MEGKTEKEETVKLTISKPDGTSFNPIVLKGQALENVRSVMREFGIPMQAAVALQITFGINSCGYYSSSEEYEMAISEIEKKNSLKLDRSKLPPFNPDCDEATLKREIDEFKKTHSGK